MARVAFEPLELVAVGGPSLELETASGALREPLQVAGVDGAAVPLGRDVQRDRRGDGRAEHRAEVAGPDGLVAEVLVGEHTGAVAGGQLEQVADIVQERGGDECVVGAVSDGEGRGLQGVVELAERLVVGIIGPAVIEVDDRFDRGCRVHQVDRTERGRPVAGTSAVPGSVHTGRPWKSPISETPACDPSARRRSNSASFSR